MSIVKENTVMSHLGRTMVVVQKRVRERNKCLLYFFINEKNLDGAQRGEWPQKKVGGRD